MKKDQGVKNISVELQGISSILFDRFIDHSKENRPPEQKLYLIDDNKVVLPAENIYSGFLFGESPAGCAKSYEGKKGREYIKTGMAHVVIAPDYIPFIDDKGKPIIFNGFGADKKFDLVMSGGKTKNGSQVVKQEAKPRPMLKTPWRLSFGITIFDNMLINENKLYNWFCAGGIVIALGTWRPRFGRFTVSKWDVE